MMRETLQIMRGESTNLYNAGKNNKIIEYIVDMYLRNLKVRRKGKVEDLIKYVDGYWIHTYGDTPTYLDSGYRVSGSLELGRPKKISEDIIAKVVADIERILSKEVEKVYRR